jgi:hypothetical protein
LFGGTTVSDNAPKGWNTQHQREFDALVAAGLKPSAKWTGNDWYVFAKELDGTPFGEPGTMSLADSISSGGKYGGQLPGTFGIAQTATGSFKADEVFQKNLAEALQEKTSPEEFTELQQESFAAPVAEGIEEFTELQPVQKDEGSVTAKRGGTVTAKEGGTVTAKRPDPEPKPKSVPLKEVIAKAVAAAKQKEKDQRSEEAEKNRAAQRRAIEQVRSRGKDLGSFRRGYGF